MKYVIQATIIFAFTFLGELLHQALPLPVPAAVYGLVLLFLALKLGIVKLHQVDAVSKFLIAIMGLFFVSPAVGIVEIWEDIAGSMMPIGVILAVSTVLVFAVAGLTTQWMLKRGGKRHG